MMSEEKKLGNVKEKIKKRKNKGKTEAKQVR
jgi:hypothetical protein